MTHSRRGFLRGALLAGATGAFPRLSWAEVGGPAYLAAAMKPTGEYALCGLDQHGAILFQIALPDRGHAAAAHPHHALAVAFARRPGTFALVIACALGLERARLEAPDGRHFYGHGAFDAAGARLYTCENAYETGDGLVGVWDARDRFKRIGEFPSGGVGPHELVFDNASGRLIVANGGVRTHPESGRAKLNLPTMRPNLAYLDASGALLEVIEPPEAFRLNSVRHLALRPDGLVGIAMQWQGDLFEAPPLLALHKYGDQELTLLSAEEPRQLALRGYAGSVAFSGDGELVGITSPRGGRLHLFAVASESFSHEVQAIDICGLAAHKDGFVATDGLGQVRHFHRDAEQPQRRYDVRWDNHIVSLSAQSA